MKINSDKLTGHPFLARKSPSESSSPSPEEPVTTVPITPYPTHTDPAALSLPLSSFRSIVFHPSSTTFNDEFCPADARRQTSDPCIWCGRKEKSKSSEYCGRGCYDLARKASSSRICPICQEVFQIRNNHVCCSLHCGALLKKTKKTSKLCPGCGRFFSPKRPDRTYCRKVCKGESQRKGFVPYTEPVEGKIARNLSEQLKQRNGKANRWGKVPPTQWTAHQFWSWLIFTFNTQGLMALGFSDFKPKDWSQLRYLYESKGIEKEKLHEVSERMIRDFHIFRNKFKWDGPFTPGQLLGFWDGIIAYLYGDGASLIRRFEENDEGWGKDADADKSYDGDEWEDEEKLGVRPLGKNGRVLVSDWRRYPEKKWTVTTFWAFLEDHLASTEFTIKLLSNEGRKKFNLLLEEKGIHEVREVLSVLVCNYAVFYGKMKWHGSLHPGMLLGFWDSLKKLACKLDNSCCNKRLESTTFDDEDRW